MTEPRYVVPPPAPVVVPVAGSDELFPVRRIFCVGRNYAEHAREMGGDPAREPPFFFAKPADAVATDGVFPYPPASADVHHEIELVVALRSGGRDIPAARALDAVFGYAVGLDMTRRDRQAEAKKHGRPWEVGKAFEGSAPLGAIVPAARIGHPSRGRIFLEVGGALRQEGDLADLIWSVPETIAILSGLFELAAGDLVMTGTPAGVAAVRRGDVMRGGIEGIGEIEVRVV